MWCSTQRHTRTQIDRYTHFLFTFLQGCVPPLQEVALRVSLPSISVFGVSAPCGALDLDNIVSPPPHSYTDTNRYTCMYIRRHRLTPIHTYTNKHTKIDLQIHTHARPQRQVHTQAQDLVWIDAYLCLRVYVYLCYTMKM